MINNLPVPYLINTHIPKKDFLSTIVVHCLMNYRGGGAPGKLGYPIRTGAVHCNNLDIRIDYGFEMPLHFNESIIQSHRKRSWKIRSSVPALLGETHYGFESIK